MDAVVIRCRPCPCQGNAGNTERMGVQLGVSLTSLRPLMQKNKEQFLQTEARAATAILSSTAWCVGLSELLPTLKEAESEQVQSCATCCH